MSPDFAAELVRHLLVEALILSAPLLIAGCLISVALSLLQTLTGVQEQTLTAVPRLLLVLLLTIAITPWFIHRTMAYTVRLWSDLHRFLG